MGILSYQLLAILSFLSAFLLAILVPGGPIETRKFVEYPELIILSFNIFLTALTFISFANTYFLTISKKWSIYVAIVCGLLFILVYLLDLLELFPVSSMAMPKTLMTIEIAGSIVAMCMIIISVLLLKNNQGHGVSSSVQYTSASLHLKLIKKLEVIMLISLIVLTGIAIVIFATHSALGS